MRSAALASLILLLGRDGVNSGIYNAGPYNLKLIRYEVCDDPGTGEVDENLYLTKRSTHKTVLTVYVYMPFDLDDSIKEYTNFASRGSQGWGNNAYILKSGKYCSTYRDNYPDLFKFVYNSWRIENPSCPIKAGNYTVELDTNFHRLKNLPSLPYGEYRLSHTMLRGDSPVNLICNRWYFSCTEIPR